MDDVIAYGEALRSRRRALTGGEGSVAAWKKDLKAMDEALKRDCAELTRARRDIAQRLARGVLAHLADLGMGKTRFEIAVEPEKNHRHRRRSRGNAHFSQSRRAAQAA